MDIWKAVPIFGGMYKITTEDDRHCLECGEPIYGRTDKVFCNRACKSRYHGQQRSLHNMAYSKTMASLQRNYGILEHLHKLKARNCPLDELTEMGFLPECVTHRVEKKGKHLEYRCFDFVYNMSENKLFNLRRL